MSVPLARAIPSRRIEPVSGCLHLCNGLDPARDGGMVPSILGMTSALLRRGESVSIVTATPSRIGPEAIPPGLAIEGPGRRLEDAVDRAEIVHVHGLWQAQSRRGARRARRSRVPTVIAAHGMADPWALRQKALKKRVYRAVVEGRNLRRANCLHALSRPEVIALRALAPRTPIGLVPNGVDLAPFEALPARSILEASHPELVGKFVLLFLGRVHPKKGLDLLARAFRAVAADHPELHLLIAGRDDGALDSFLRAVGSAGLGDRATSLGHVAGESARRAWGASDAFVLPSHSEGFSMAVLEALAARRPALVTSACNFPELAAVEGAVTVEATAPGVTAGLRELLGRSARERSAMAGRARALVEAEYTWDRQAERLSAVYRWAIGGGPPPEAVERAGEVG